MGRARNPVLGPAGDLRACRLTDTTTARAGSGQPGQFYHKKMNKEQHEKRHSDADFPRTIRQARAISKTVRLPDGRKEIRTVWDWTEIRPPFKQENDNENPNSSRT